MPPMDAPVESCRYLPTKPLPLARPLEKREDFEFSKILADSHELAASMTTLAVTVYSCISSLLTKETPVALPSPLIVTSRAIAFGITSTFPVATAGFTRTDDDEKSACTVQPRLHCLQ